MQEKNIELFKPSYVWPNPAFHFRLYYKSNNCRVFIIENITHNWKWLKEYSHRFQENDYFLVSLGWYFDEYLVNECNHIFNILNLRKDRFYFMYNDFSDKSMFDAYGFQGDLINQNCFLDENLFNILPSEKIYDAIYTARLSDFKRHYLASNIKNLALVAGNASGPLIDRLPSHAYINDRHLSSEEVKEKLSQSRVGLILSAFEGACYASSEYLLCGLPVVSTNSYGGRNIWYNNYNSITCDANPEDVSDAVIELIKKNRDGEKIRSMHIELANYFRKKFIALNQMIFDASGDNVSAANHFKDNFMHKLFKSETPNFEEIFPA